MRSSDSPVVGADLLVGALFLVSSAACGRADRDDPPHHAGDEGPPPLGMPAPREPKQTTSVVPAVLTSAFSPGARPSTCVTLKDERVTAIGEQSCEPVSPSEFCDPSCDAWHQCGGCLMHLDKPTHGPWVFEARPGPKCVEFGGTYVLGGETESCSGELADTGQGRGSRIESFVETARTSICVSVLSGTVIQIDELACTVETSMHECAPDDCPWIRCGGCLLHAHEDDSGSLILKARLDGGACPELGAIYEVRLDEACAP